MRADCEVAVVADLSFSTFCCRELNQISDGDVVTALQFIQLLVVELYMAVSLVLNEAIAFFLLC